MKIKVLSYNVHKFYNLIGTNYFLSSLKELFSAMDLDLVFLQETRGLQPEGLKDHYDRDPLEHLADEIWEHFIYGKNAISSSGHHGNAILSKYPIGKWENFNISTHPLEQRGLLVGNIDEINLQVCCTHLDLTSMGRKRQVKKIQEIFKTRIVNESPILFCGDINDWDGHTSQRILKLGLECANDMSKENLATYPSFFPMLSLDKIFFRGIECKNVRVLNDAIWKQFSDHLPIYAEFLIKKT